MVVYPREVIPTGASHDLIPPVEGWPQGHKTSPRSD